MNKEIKFSLRSFPNSDKEPFLKTSDPTFMYNCIGWSVHDDKKWWWPDKDSFWPEEIKREESLVAFNDLYKSIGYEICENSKIEEGFEKIVLFADDKNVPTHAARQLSEHKWTSKLGSAEDVEHTLESMTQGFYGNPILYFKKKLS